MKPPKKLHIVMHITDEFKLPYFACHTNHTAAKKARDELMEVFGGEAGVFKFVPAADKRWEKEDEGG